MFFTTFFTFSGYISPLESIATYKKITDLAAHFTFLYIIACILIGLYNFAPVIYRYQFGPGQNI